MMFFRWIIPNFPVRKSLDDLRGSGGGSVKYYNYWGAELPQPLETFLVASANIRNSSCHKHVLGWLSLETFLSHKELPFCKISNLPNQGLTRLAEALAPASVEYQGFDQVQANAGEKGSNYCGIRDRWGLGKGYYMYICDETTIIKEIRSIRSDFQTSCVFFIGFPCFFHVHLVVREILDFAPWSWSIWHAASSTGVAPLRRGLWTSTVSPAKTSVFWGLNSNWRAQTNRARNNIEYRNGNHSTKYDSIYTSFWVVKQI